MSPQVVGTVHTQQYNYYRMNSNILILIFLFILICNVISLANANDNNNVNNNSSSMTTYLRRNLANDDDKLCTCDKVECGLCMTGCSPSTSDDCNTGRNWCYCNMMGIACLEVTMIIIIVF